MPTNDERREVAARLREVWASGCTFVSFFEFDCDDFETCQECSKCCGNRLADLIEPEPERTCHMEFRKHGAIYDVFYFDCCDEEFSESRTDQYASGISGNVCPYCGAKVVGE